MATNLENLENMDKSENLKVIREKSGKMCCFAGVLPRVVRYPALKLRPYGAIEIRLLVLLLLFEANINRVENHCVCG